jgi:hypothetical protein
MSPGMLGRFLQNLRGVLFGLCGFNASEEVATDVIVFPSPRIFAVVKHHASCESSQTWDGDRIEDDHRSSADPFKGYDNGNGKVFVSVFDSGFDFPEVVITL